MKKVRKNNTTNGLGTFSGVFTPSVLTILGIILFLRLGYVTGAAGFLRTLFIIGIANLISVLTSISLSTVATNIKVKGGGDYYLISRTLGLEYGGALGLVLFLAQSVSIAFYCIGFGEATALMLPKTLNISPQIIAAMAVLMLFMMAWMGADWASKFQFVVMAFLVLALGSFFWGGIQKFDTGVLQQNLQAPDNSPPFWVLFAVFFPAVTGFTQGVSMSGDLQNPGKSLPLGTFLAVGVSIVIYFAVTIIFSGAMSNEMLMTDYSAMKKVARFGFLIDAGVIAATLSSAMASFLGAPRILQSLAKDRIFPFLNFFAKGSGATDNPRRGVYLAAIIAFGVILMGNLNAVAAIVSMFFLISYGLLNYATYFEAASESPSFRPTFKWFDRRFSMAGFLACLLVMLAIDVKNGIIALAVLFAIYQYLRRTASISRWADGRRSAFLQNVRNNLWNAYIEPHHFRDWRPQILVFFSDDIERRSRLTAFGSWLSGKWGFTTLVKICDGKGLNILKERDNQEAALKRELMEKKQTVFPLVMVSQDFTTAVYYLLQSYGIGPIKANIVLMNWLNPENISGEGFREYIFGSQLKEVFRFRANIILLHTDEKRWLKLKQDTHGEDRTIDVWWWGDATSQLMLLLAYLLTRNEYWEDATIRLIAETKNHPPEERLQELEQVLSDIRIDADIHLIPEMTAEGLIESSKDVDFIFFPFRLKGNLIQCPLPGRVENYLVQLPSAAMVLAAEDLDLDAEPEDGAAADSAAIIDEYKELSQLAKKSMEESEKANKRVTELQAKLSETDDDEKIKLTREIKEAEFEAQRLFRKKAKAIVKADDAIKKAEETGLIAVDKSETEGISKI
ncbi:MAG: amino acid permease [Candidatus Magnetomorum sp.]|nr:amino acid permease [Candidatus Magnetomorum sp.]